jgi:hypothetical protein
MPPLWRGIEAEHNTADFGPETRCRKGEGVADSVILPHRAFCGKLKTGRMEHYATGIYGDETG